MSFDRMRVALTGGASLSLRHRLSQVSGNHDSWPTGGRRMKVRTGCENYRQGARNGSSRDAMMQSTDVVIAECRIGSACPET